MQYLTGNSVPEVYTIIQVDPDKLIELGHRLKQHSMDFAKHGESLTVPLTEKILLLYEPTEQYVKPTHTYYSDTRTYFAPAIQSTGEEATSLQ